MTHDSYIAQVKSGIYPLNVVFFLDNPQSIAFTLDMLAPFFQCTVSRASEASNIDGSGRELGSSAVVMVVDHTGLNACCNLMHRLSHAWPKVPLIVLTDEIETAGVARLLGCGAFDFAELRGSVVVNIDVTSSYSVCNSSLG